MKVIFVIIDCMRWDYISSNGYPRPTTPNIDRIAEQSCVFERAYAAINQTDQSLTSIFSGCYPITHGLEQTAASMSHRRLASLNAWRIQYLPVLLKEAGFVTLGVDWLDRWHRWGYDWYWGRDRRRGRWLLRQAFSPFAKMVLSMARHVQFRGSNVAQLVTMKPGVNAETATDWALKILERYYESDVFLMLHYWDAHAPYDVKREELLDVMDRITLPGEDRNVRALIELLCKSKEYKKWALNYVIRDATTTGQLISQHCASLRTVDEQIGRIHEYLEGHCLSDQAVLVLTADHGENFFETERFIEHTGVRENVIRVPLIMRFPGVGPCQIDQVVSHVDLVPTLADYLGLQVSPWIDGLSLMSTMAEGQPLDREYVYFQSRLTEPNACRGIVGERYKYFRRIQANASTCRYCNRLHAPPAELYDLINDEAERNNLAHGELELAKKLSMSLDHLVERLSERSALIASEKAEADDFVYDEKDRAEMERRLRGLGYLD